jgi:hypothetical protein
MTPFFPWLQRMFRNVDFIVAKFSSNIIWQVFYKNLGTGHITFLKDEVFN